MAEFSISRGAGSRCVCDILRVRYASNVAAFALEGLFQILGRFFLRAFGIVASANGLVILVDRTVALARNIENISELDMRPHLRPRGGPVAVYRLAVLVGRGLIIVLQEENLSDAIVCQGTGAVHFNGLLIFLQGVSQLADRDKLLAAFDRYLH